MHRYTSLVVTWSFPYIFSIESSDPVILHQAVEKQEHYYNFGEYYRMDVSIITHLGTSPNGMKSCTNYDHF